MNCQPKRNTILPGANLVEELMRSRPEQFAHLLHNPEKYEIQIIYTQIDRDSANRPSFKSYHYQPDSGRYFYPASTVKLPTALLALEKLNELGIDNLDKNTSMLTDSVFSGQSSVGADSTSPNGLPSIAHYIKKVLLVSDNDAFNRLYEFVGQERINARLHAKGYENTNIRHRLSIFLSEEENRHTNPVRFVQGDTLIYAQPEAINKEPLARNVGALKGVGYMANNSLVQEPMDFSQKNALPLRDMHEILKALIFPEAVSQKQRFDLSPADYQFVYQYMSQLPSETSYPAYDTAEYYDAYVKFLMHGNDKAPLPKYIRIFNKIGDAYGFMIDHAYIVDFEHKTEFMLSAVILANDNGIFNDGNYEYDSIGYPFMRNLGRLIYDYELQRTRKFKPDLSRFMIPYDKVVMSSEAFHPNLYQNYHHYHIPALSRMQIKRSDIEPYLDALLHHPAFEVSKVGESVEGRDINLVKAGTGSRSVMLWSQMHGDESTATRAMMEIFRFFTTHDALDAWKSKLLSGLTLYFIPMLNPDGAEAHVRRNSLGIDLNRDALRLVSPEAKILKDTRDKYKPDFGFNLHDQSKYYNVHRTAKTASISFLAPAYNDEKEINECRRNAMLTIVGINNALQQYIPGRLGRYDDAFEPRAFGDNIQKWGTSTILVESGGLPGDPEKSELVRLNFVAILHALDMLASGHFATYDHAAYFDIPENDRKLVDQLIRNATLHKDGHDYLMDIGLMLQDGDQNATAIIDDMGDLSTYYGYEEIDASGMQIMASGWQHTSGKNQEIKLQPGVQANFVLAQHGETIYEFIHGKLIKTRQ